MQINIYKYDFFYGDDLFLHRLFNSVKGLIAYVMLDLAGVCRCVFLADAQSDEKFGQQSVTVVHLMSNLCTKLCKSEISVGINRYVAAVFQKAYCAADAWL